MKREAIAPIALGALLLVIWALLAGPGTAMLPTPLAVGQAVVRDLTDRYFWGSLGVTVVEAVGGTLAGVVFALPLAVVLYRSRLAAAAVNPYLGASQAIPAVALAPLLALWLGYGLVPVVALCALMVFFPILIATVVGLRHIDAQVVDAARMECANSWQLLIHIELPLALPSILGGLRNGVSLAVTGAIVGEMVMGGDGLGTVLAVQRGNFDIAGMFATIFWLAALAAAAYLAVLGWERNSRIVSSLNTRTER
jgi:NitT/TauT family transport system permease protein